MQSTSFTRLFLQETTDIVARASAAAVDDVVGLLRATRDRGGRLFLCGSGGGAGHASHAACDFRKLAGMEAYCVTDNVSELTARVNDDGWDSAYSNWLKASRINARDTLFVFSVGGGDAERQVSVNLVNAMRVATEVGAAITGIAGRDGGELARRSDCCILVPPGRSETITAQTEALQALFWHLIVTHPELCLSTPRWEALTGDSVS